MKIYIIYNEFIVIYQIFFLTFTWIILFYFIYDCKLYKKNWFLFYYFKCYVVEALPLWATGRGV